MTKAGEEIIQGAKEALNFVKKYRDEDLQFVADDIYNAVDNWVGDDFEDDRLPTGIYTITVTYEDKE